MLSFPWSPWRAVQVPWCKSKHFDYLSWQLGIYQIHCRPTFVAKFCRSRRKEGLNIEGRIAGLSRQLLKIALYSQFMIIPQASRRAWGTRSCMLKRTELALNYENFTAKLCGSQPLSQVQLEAFDFLATLSHFLCRDKKKRNPNVKKLVAVKIRYLSRYAKGSSWR